MCDEEMLILLGLFGFEVDAISHTSTYLGHPPSPDGWVLTSSSLRHKAKRLEVTWNEYPGDYYSGMTQQVRDLRYDTATYKQVMEFVTKTMSEVANAPVPS
jgi:hypothetical protein